MNSKNIFILGLLIVIALLFFFLNGRRGSISPALVVPAAKQTTSPPLSLARNRWLETLERRYARSQNLIDRCLKEEELKTPELTLRTTWNSLGKLTKLVSSPSLSEKGTACFMGILLGSEEGEVNAPAVPPPAWDSAG